MSNIDYKAIKKLADVCRKAGIKHYKSADFEFTLTDEAPVSLGKASAKQAELSSDPGSLLTGSGLSEQELLYWSAGIPEGTADETV